MEKSFFENNPIDGFDSETSKYLYSLFASISNVDSSYIYCDSYHSEEDIEHVERAFAYELYHQWCNNSIIKNCKNLIVNAEIPKELICEAKNFKKSLTYPDMVLHHGQNDYKGNLIICEIKRDSYARQNPDKVLEDFDKLNIYLSDKLKVKRNNEDWEPFRIGVFIMTDKENTKSPLSVHKIFQYLGKKVETIMKYHDDIKQRIVCVVYNGKELKYDILYNLTNKNNI